MLNDNFDLMIVNGDLVIGNSNVQHQDLLLIAQQSSFKQSPYVGVGIENFLMDDDVTGIVGKVREEFIKDGQQLTSINYNEQTEQLTYDADYPN